MEYDLNLTTVTIVSCGLLLFALVSRRLAGSMITPPLVFVAFGLVIGEAGLGTATVDPGRGGIHLLAELTLILVLFADAARIDVNKLRSDHRLPMRMLTLAMPLTILLGALAAAWLFPGLGVWEMVLLAALLAPTDAALGQAVVSAPQVPVRIRQAINVESGLNDGIALPAVLFFATLAGAHHGADSANGWLRFVALQLVLGPAIGIVIGYVGARLIDETAQRRWASEPFQGIAILALALLSFSVAELLGGNGFIAAFVSGMVFGHVVRHACTFLFEFMESEGQLLTLITFLIFGAVLLPEGLAHATPAMMIYALLSLTVVRMLPVAVSLLGSGVRLQTRLFLGWFGPRGLASILFVLLILEESSMLHKETLLSVTVITVALSVVLHGLTAAPFARAYGRFADSMGECTEKRAVSEMPLRHGNRRERA